MAPPILHREVFHRMSQHPARKRWLGDLLAGLLILGRVHGPAEVSELFSQKAPEAGIDFVHVNGMSGELFMPEIVGSGEALFDCDNDDDLDLFLVQGNLLGPDKTLADAIFQPRGPLLVGRLYRNDLVVQADGSRRLRFTDITKGSGITRQDYGMGVAAGDYNNDGWVDLYITSLEHNLMYRNQGNCTFTDVTEQTRTDDPRWSVSAAFVDFDRDGWLDLFVGNYVDFRFTNRKLCLSPSGAKDYCGPLAYKPLPNRLFRNRGDGTFQDVTARSRIATEYEGALGVVSADFDGDGWPDIYVANDGRPNQLWINQRNDRDDESERAERIGGTWRRWTDACGESLADWKARLR